MSDLGRRRDGAGFVLLFSLFLTIALGALGVSMLRGVPVRERMAGNAIDRQQAWRAAQDALQYAETWLVQEQGDAPLECLGVIDARTARPRVCKGRLEAPLLPPWPTRTENLPLPGNQSGDGSVSRSAIHIVEIGLGPSGLDRFYEITAVGYGPAGALGTGAVTVLRSTFRLGTAARNLGVQ